VTTSVYRAVSLVGIAQIIAYAAANYLPAVIATPASQELGLSTTTIFAGFSLSLSVAGLCGPFAGKLVDRVGGRPILILSNIVFAAGFSLLGLAQDIVLLFTAYAILGLAMAAGLFEVAFASIVRLFGKNSRNAITGVSLIAGFASVAGWTLSVYVQARFGWRGVCWFWAGMHLLVALPLNALIPSLSKQIVTDQLKQADPNGITEKMQTNSNQNSNSHAVSKNQSAKYTTILLAFIFATSSFIGMGLMSHLPRLLEDIGVPLAIAFTIGALVGPAQIIGRILDFTFLRRMHPLIGTRIAALAHPIGAIALLIFGAPLALTFVILHGLGNGILIISRGTLPLALFGAQGYGQRQGWLMMPSRFAQAASPFLFGLALTEWGSNVLWLSCAMALSIFAALCLIKIEQN
jgi:predicted MFS family arabinose efflux permease